MKSAFIRFRNLFYSEFAEGISGKTAVAPALFLDDDAGFFQQIADAALLFGIDAFFDDEAAMRAAGTRKGLQALGFGSQLFFADDGAVEPEGVAVEADFLGRFGLRAERAGKRFKFGRSVNGQGDFRDPFGAVAGFGFVKNEAVGELYGLGATLDVELGEPFRFGDAAVVKADGFLARVIAHGFRAAEGAGAEQKRQGEKERKCFHGSIFPPLPPLGNNRKMPAGDNAVLFRYSVRL